MDQSISVIIVSYNTKDLLQDCLQSLYASGSHEFLEVFVVDNASRDGSPGMVRDQFPQAHVLAETENLGFAAANNLAYSKSRGEYVFLLNPDARLEREAISQSVQYMESDPSCGLCGGQILNMDGSPAPSARSFPGMINKLLVLSGLSSRYPSSRFFGRQDMTYLDDTSPVPVDWVPGTFSCIRRGMLEEIGFFDPRFFMYYEETDLCLRAKRNGWKVVFLPWAKAWHVGGACSKTRKDKTFDAAGSQLLQYRLRSEMLYWRKNYGMLSMLGNIDLDLLFHGLRYLKNRLFGKAGAMKLKESKAFLQQSWVALKDTAYGKQSPPFPW